MANLFNTPKPKAFKVEPRYWDPEKEKREARDRRIKAEMGKGEEGDSYRPYISPGDFRQGLSKGKWTLRDQRRKSNTRLLILVALISLLLYFIFS